MRQSTRRPLGVAITRVLATALIVVGGFFAFAPSSSATVLPDPIATLVVNPFAKCVLDVTGTVGFIADSIGDDVDEVQVNVYVWKVGTEKPFPTYLGSDGPQAFNSKSLGLNFLSGDVVNVQGSIYEVRSGSPHEYFSDVKQVTVPNGCEVLPFVSMNLLTSCEGVLESGEVATNLVSPDRTKTILVSLNGGVSVSIPSDTFRVGLTASQLSQLTTPYGGTFRYESSDQTFPVSGRIGPPEDCPPETTAPPTTQPPVTTVPATTAPPTTQPPVTTVPATTVPPTTVKPPTTTVPSTTVPVTTAPPTTTTTSPPPTTPTTTPPSGTLPVTGAGTTRQQSGLALVLVIAGVVMLLISRKRARL